MTKQSENSEVIKLKNQTVPDPVEQKRIDQVAEEAAEKSSRTGQRYDKGHQIFSK